MIFKFKNGLGLLAFLGILIVVFGYFATTKCGLNFELKSDGYYLVRYESDVDTHMVGVIENTIYVDGPFTEKEVKKMLDECETPLKSLKNHTN